ncbi:hypothetical protein [Pseudomonas phage D6]|nr:hypothetical protein [Pseudomonas phage D6]
MPKHLVLKRDTHVGGGLTGAGYVMNLSGRYASLSMPYPPLASFYDYMDQAGWELHTPPLKTMNAHAKEIYLMTFRHKKKSVPVNSLAEMQY